jgi:hypothetical protein
MLFLNMVCLTVVLACRPPPCTGAYGVDVGKTFLLDRKPWTELGTSDFSLLSGAYGMGHPRGY